MVTPHHHKVVQLTKEYAKLTRDDRTRYEQILWAMQGELRRLPSEFGFHVPVAMMLLGGGARERAREHVQLCLDGLKRATMQPFLVNILIGQLTALGMFEDANRLLLLQLQLNLPDELRARLHQHAFDLALRSGSVELLHRCAQAGHGPVPQARFLLEHLQKLDLLAWLPRQQRALEPVLGPITTAFQTSILTDDSGSRRLHLAYCTSSPTPDLRALRERVFEVLHDTYETHPRGPAAWLGHLVVDVRGPYIAAHEPADRARSAYPPDDLGTQELWRGVRRFAAGLTIDPALRRNWAIDRAYFAALTHLLAAAPALGLRVGTLDAVGPYQQLIAGIAGSFNRGARFAAMRLELLHCAATLANYSPAHQASATDVAEILDLAASLVGDAAEPEPEQTTACDAPPPQPPPPPDDLARLRTLLQSGDEPAMTHLVEAQLTAVRTTNPELERAMRRVLKLMRSPPADPRRKSR